MRRTKKVRYAGKFGPRYGKAVKERYNKVMETKIKKYDCPICSKEKSVRRIAFGIWQCKKCKTKFASGAYEFVWKDS